MISTEAFSAIALSFPEAVAAPHFDRTAFKVKKIFATLHQASLTANLKLAPGDQAAFCAIDASVMYPVPNKWGLQGWTTVVLETVDEDLLVDALTCAYIANVPAKLAAPYIAEREKK